MKKSLAISYAMKKKNKYPDGGIVKKEKESDSFEKAGQAISGSISSEKAKELAKIFKAHGGEMYSKGGGVYDVSSPEEILNEQDDLDFIPDQPDYDWVDGVKNKVNTAARFQDHRDLNEQMVVSHDSMKEDLVDRIMNRKNKDYSSLSRLAMGGAVGNPYENDKQDMVDRILMKFAEGGKVGGASTSTTGNKTKTGGSNPGGASTGGAGTVTITTGKVPPQGINISNVGGKTDARNPGGMDPSDEEDEMMMSKGGRVANDVGTGQEADKLPNQHDDLVLRDYLESSYGDYDNAGDSFGNDQEDEDRKDIVSRIMKSRAKKDRMPNPA